MSITNKPEAQVALPSDREITITRMFEAPPELLFEAWTEPAHLPHWWGCTSGALTTCEVDLRVGGEWRLVMRMADGSEHPFRGTYKQIERPLRLVYSECYDVAAFGRPEWLTTVTFEAMGDQTRLTHNILHASREARDGHLKSGMESGIESSMKRLGERVQLMAEAAVQRA